MLVIPKHTYPDPDDERLEEILEGEAPRDTVTTLDMPLVPAEIPATLRARRPRRPRIERLDIR